MVTIITSVQAIFVLVTFVLPLENFQETENVRQICNKNAF